MKRIESKLTVLFDDPFWIGLYERECDEGYEVCKMIFGPEPKDYEVLEYMHTHWKTLRLSPAIQSVVKAKKQSNPKRRAREVRKQTQEEGIGTKAQKALALAREQGKLMHKTRSHAQKEAEQKRKFALRQEKRKEKHRGH